MLINVTLHNQFIFNRYKCNLNTHLKLHTGEMQKRKEKIQCSVCGEQVLKYGIKRHMLIHTDPVKCQECNLTLLNQQSYEHHQREFHLNAGVLFPCQLCPRTFRRQRTLRVKKKNYFNFYIF